MPSIFDVPSGPKNLAVLFPDIIWETVDQFYIQALAGGTIAATSPIYKMGCCCSDEDVIVHFLNSLGKFDSIPFQKPNISHETKSGLYSKSLNYNFNRKDWGWQRINVSSNDIYECKNSCLSERDMLWVQELFDSPLAFLQYDSDNQIDVIGDDYLPITILDNTFMKENDDFGVQVNVLTIKFTLGNKFFTQRN